MIKGMKTGIGPQLAAMALLAWGLVASPVIHALGLGEARVESYMHEPIDARIRLISRSEAELATVTASLASADDFRIIGLDRAALSVPLTFEVIADLDDPHIRVRSVLPVDEPVVQLVVEVVWASGRMLRQYTLFLDPPTIDAAAPLPGVSRAPSRPEPEVVSAPAAPEPVEPVLEPTPEASPPRQEVQTIVEPTPGSGSDDEYGPVQRGQTLWGIATRLARERGYSVNQLMLAIQQQNPGAFNRGNINSLKAGSVLRLPSRDMVMSYDQQEAMLEVQRQEVAWRAGRGGTRLPSDEVSLVADVGLGEDGEASASADSPEPEASASSDQDPVPGQDDSSVSAALENPVAEGRLELVPPAADEALSEDAGTGNAGDENEEGAISVSEELARTQEELVNAQQENQYLSERIQELESELARRTQAVDESGLIEDSSLAEMEDRLREQRQSGETPEVKVIPREEERPWLARWTTWVIGLVLLGVAAIVWWLRRQRKDDVVVQEITEDAEDILRVLGDEAKADDDAISDTAMAAGQGSTRATAAPRVDEEAIELDADDPETKLDLARAYLSMGDLLAARDILLEVVESGDEAQIAEARRMMQEL